MCPEIIWEPSPRSGPSRHPEALRKSPAAPAAVIAAERIAGTIVLISGTDDALWPSTLYAQRIVDRLEEHGGQGRACDERITGAGHFSAFPYAIPALPSMCRLSPTRAFSIDFGGTPAVNAAATQHSWALLRTELSTWASDTGNSREPGMLPGGGCA